MRIRKRKHVLPAYSHDPTPSRARALAINSTRQSRGAASRLPNSIAVVRVENEQVSKGRRTEEEEEEEEKEEQEGKAPATEFRADLSLIPPEFAVGNRGRGRESRVKKRNRLQRGL